MSRRRRLLLRATNLRRMVQLLFLVAFIGLVLYARSHTSMEKGASPLLQAFFLFDPFLLIATFLTAHTVVSGLLLSLVVIGLTLILGRVFCGWICPLGTIHAGTGWLLDRIWPNRRRRAHWSRWQLAKDGLLIGFLVMALLGSHWGCVFDPLVLLYRSTATALLPGVQWGVEEVTTTLDKAENRAAKKVYEYVKPVNNFLLENAWGGVDLEGHAFLGGGLILGVFLVLVGLNAVKRRFWCRFLCPLGALLGIFAWRPFWRRDVKESCNECDLCGGPCEGAATTAPGDHWKATECLGCLNCTDACNRDSVTFTWTWPWRRVPRIEPVNLPRRAALGSAVGGLAGLVLLRINPQAREKTINPDLIRPPGARPEREFLQRCTACGLCLEVCPTGGLQPSFLEAGLEGLWTPRLVPRIGCCEQECNLCTQVCPTQALEPLTLEAKKKWRIGLAFFDTGRCLPYAFGRDCGVCEECCPVPDKAIFVVEVEVTDREGQKQTIKQPHVDPTKCTGCGKCEKKCLFQDRPAIRVTSANETRNEENRPILGI